MTHGRLSVYSSKTDPCRVICAYFKDLTQVGLSVWLSVPRVLSASACAHPSHLCGVSVFLGNGGEGASHTCVV